MLNRETDLKTQKTLVGRLHFKLNFLAINQFIKLDIPEAKFMEVNLLPAACSNQSILFIVK